MAESAHTLRRLPAVDYEQDTAGTLQSILPPYRGYEEVFTVTAIGASGSSAEIDVRSMLTAGITVVAVNNGSADSTLDIFVQETDNGTNYADKNTVVDIAITDSVLFGRKAVDCYGRGLRLRWIIAGTTKDFNITVTVVKKN